MILKVGHGYDVHRLVADRKLILGGVEIPYPYGLLGHSDADVLAHAIADALLGAAGKRDIGFYFPDNDPRYHGISSMILLQEIKKMLDENALSIGNIDATVVAQAPKLSPYIESMRKELSFALQIPFEAVNVKATTEEKLGFTGTGEGIAAHAVCCLFG